MVVGMFQGINGDDGPPKFSLLVWEGAYDKRREAIVETDRALNLPTDTPAILDAIVRVTDGTIEQFTP